MLDNEIGGKIKGFVGFVIVAFVVGTLFGESPFGIFLVSASLIIFVIGIIVGVMFFLLTLFVDLGNHDCLIEETPKTISKEQTDKLLQETWFLRGYGSMIIFVLLSLGGQLIIWQTLGKILFSMHNETLATIFVVVMIFYEIAVFKVTRFFVESRLKVLFQDCQISNLERNNLALNKGLNPKKYEIKEVKYSKKVQKEIEAIRSLGKRLQ